MAINFTPHPQIAPCKSVYDADLKALRQRLGLSHKLMGDDIQELTIHPEFPWRSFYTTNYEAVFRDIAGGEDHDREARAKGAQRALIKRDLFYIVAFVMEVPLDLCNNPYVVDSCRELEESTPDGGLSATDILDIESREHFKSTIRTVALTIKRVVNDPDCCTFIFSYKKDAAAKFLTAIKETFERPLLIWAFPDIFYSNPGYESPSWSLQNGIVVKRKSASRREKTVEAFGLVEGMPIGGHADHRIYDDVETFDIAKSADQMNLCFNSFEMSFSLGRQGGTELIHGTYYHFHGPLIRIRDKKKADGTPVYRLIIKPCTHDGTRQGKPVLFSPEYLQACIEKSGKNFDSQYLCNPAPVDTITLDKSMLNRIDPAFLRTGKWADRYKFLIVDQAGGTDTNISGPGDMWAIGVVSIVPSVSLASRTGTEATDDDLGISDICVEDLIADQMTHSQAIDTIVRMYLKHGMIMQVGVEKVALSTTEIHVVDALAAKGRKLSVPHGNLFLLRPAGRKLENRISSALEWPLNNGHISYSTGIDPEYVEKMKQEMDQFGFGHSDILNIVSYAYDMFRVFPFHRYQKRKVQSVTSLMAAGSAGGRVKGEWG